MSSEFGVCIASYPGDLRFGLGAIESVRHFLGDVPICVVWDGPGDLPAVRRTYSAHVLHRANTTDPWLRADSFGFGWTKMVAFWESPFDRFLYFDADAVLWGDLWSRASVEMGDRWDLIVDRPGSECTQEDIDKWYVRTDLAQRVIPEFDWRRHRGDFTATGAMFVKKGVIPRASYQRYRQLAREHPALFFPGEQGALNCLIWSLQDAGILRVEGFSFHDFALDHSVEELARRFPIGPRGPLPSDEPAGVLHWPLKKPWSVSTDVYTAPMTYFREQAFVRMRPILAPWRSAIIRLSDQWALLRPRLKWQRIPAAADRRFRRLLGLPVKEE